MPQLLPQMVAGTRYRNEVAVATYFLIEVAAATSHNHAYRATRKDSEKEKLPSIDAGPEYLIFLLWERRKFEWKCRNSRAPTCTNN